MKFFWSKEELEVNIAAAEKMHQIANRTTGHESGGLLIGWWDGQSIVINDATEVYDPTATETSWMRREAIAQVSLDEILSKSDDEKLGYVGDWHSHPQAIGASRTDLFSLKRASLQYARPIALVIRLPNGTFDVHVARQGKHCKVNSNKQER